MKTMTTPINTVKPNWLTAGVELKIKIAKTNKELKAEMSVVNVIFSQRPCSA